MDKRITKVWFFVLLGISIFSFSLWFLAFYPGLLSQDAINQWTTISIGAHSNTIPFTHTLIVRGLVNIWKSPASVTVFQIILSSVLSSSLTYILIKNGANKYAAFIAYLLFITSPVIGIYNMTIWKDVMFAQGIFALSVIFISDYLTKRKFTTLYLLFLSLAVAYISTLRHNGLMLVLAFPSVYLFAKIVNFKKYLSLQATTLVIFLLIWVILPKILHVIPIVSYVSKTSQILMIEAVANKRGLNESDQQVISKLVNYDQFKNTYSRCDSGIMKIYSDGWNEEIFDDKSYVREFNSLFLRTLKPQNLPIILKDRACMFYATFGGNKSTAYYQAQTISNKFSLKTQPLQKELHGIFLDLLEKSNRTPWRYLVWQGLIVLTFYLVSFFWAIAKGNRLVAGYLIPYLILTLFLFPIISTKEYRFLYFLQYSGYFLIPLLTIKQKSK